MTITVAALFVEAKGVYASREGVDAWPETRDARRYLGPWPVVAHPPCSAWCQLAPINRKRYGHAIGADAGCFASALGSLRRFGGVLEHPARSYAWPAFGLQRPRAGSWQRTPEGHWTTQVSQAAYGCRARKLTWLLVNGPRPQDLDWTVPKPTAQVSFCGNHGNSPLPRLGKREAKATPLAFAELLLSIARTYGTEQK